MANLKEMMQKEVRKLFKDFLQDTGNDLLADYTNPVSQQVGLVFLKQANKLESNILKDQPKREPRGSQNLEFPANRDNLYFLHIAVTSKTNFNDTVVDLKETLKKDGWENLADDRFTPDYYKLVKGDNKIKVSSDYITMYGSKEEIENVGVALKNAKSENFMFEGYGKIQGVRKTTESELLSNYNIRKAEIEKMMLDLIRNHPANHICHDGYVISHTEPKLEPGINSVQVERRFNGKRSLFEEFGQKMIENLKERNLIEEKKNRLVIKPKMIVMENNGKSRELLNDRKGR